MDVTLAGGGAAWVQLGRSVANELDLASGDPVWISRAGASGRHARTGRRRARRAVVPERRGPYPPARYRPPRLTTTS